jgi:hypothetical protein
MCQSNRISLKTQILGLTLVDQTFLILAQVFTYLALELKKMYTVIFGKPIRIRRRFSRKVYTNSEINFYFLEIKLLIFKFRFSTEN